MKSNFPKLAASSAAAAMLLTLATASPAGAQAAPPPRGLGALLGSILGGGTPAPPPPVPAPAPTSTPNPYNATAGAAATAGPATPLAVEQHLSGLRYPVGPIDGVVDNETSSAVMAFQKVHGMPRTGQLTGDVARAIMAADDIPTPLVPNSDANKVEIDLTRQVLFLYEGGSLSNIIPISSGTAETPTPTGSYRIIRRATGWETSPLGRLYNSQYFVGGYAIHGSLSVPNFPASHGCVRLPMSVAEWFPDHVGLGTPVYVLGG
jgi:lipoprotein-anchoring transpeptidase ErfK/SrfK